MQTVAETFLKKFPPSHHTYDVKKSGSECLLDIKEFVAESADKYVGKDYSIEHLIGAILKDHRKLTDAEFSAFMKCNLVAAKYYFERLCKRIKNTDNGLTYHSVKKVSPKITDFLHDYRPLIEYFKRQENKNYTFFRGGKNYSHHTFELFLTYKNLFWANDSNINIPGKTRANLACFTLRQSIEQKLMRILGLYSFHNRTYDGPKVGNEFFIDFLKEFSSNIEFGDLKPATLQQVYKWTNLTIHSSIVPRSWELYLAIDYADKLLEPISDETSFSAENRIKVRKFNKLQKDLLEKLYKANNEEIICIRVKEPESKIISYS